MQSIIVNNKVIVYFKVVDLDMSISDWINFRINNPDVYWHLVYTQKIPEEILYSIEIEFDD